MRIRTNRTGDEDTTLPIHKDSWNSVSVLTIVISSTIPFEGNDIGPGSARERVDLQIKTDPIERSPARNSSDQSVSLQNSGQSGVLVEDLH